MKKSFVLEKIIENKKNNIANLHIGMIIKKKRLEKKMTLEETTKGICCVSYLSKLEHGIIEPKKYVMEDVLRRLDVQNTALRSSMEYDELLLQCIKYLRVEDEGKIEELYNSLSSDDDIHFADILRIAYFLTKKEYEKAIKLIDKTLDVKEHLDDHEIVTLFLLIAIYDYDLHDFAESLDCCLLLEQFYIYDININLLRTRLIIENKFILGEYSTMNKYINEYHGYCIKAGEYQGIKRGNYLYSISIARDGFRYEAYRIYEDIEYSLDKKEKDDWKKDICLALGSAKEALEYDLSPLEKMWAYDALGQKERVRRILDELDDSDLSILEKIFVQVMKKKNTADGQNLAMYLKETAFAYMIKHGFYFEALYYGKMLIAKLTSGSRYKDSIQVYEKINEMRKLRWKI